MIIGINPQELWAEAQIFLHKTSKHIKKAMPGGVKRMCGRNCLPQEPRTQEKNKVVFSHQSLETKPQIPAPKRSEPRSCFPQPGGDKKYWEDGGRSRKRGAAGHTGKSWGLPQVPWDRAMLPTATGWALP